MYRLFDEFSHRYDLHTSPDHYQHDHDFVLEVVRRWGSPCHILDVGCGTGVFLEKALRAGLVAKGIDASPGMVRVAERRLGQGVVSIRRMQELEEDRSYHAIISLSWTLNYCEDQNELLDVLQRFHRALNPGGGVILQVAHAAHAPVGIWEDREPGPSGEPDDVLFLYRFHRMDATQNVLAADYIYACKSRGELLHEQHLLHVADARAVAACMQKVGFAELELYDSFRRDPFHGSVSPFVVGRKPARSEPT
jgi:ubiquinone/menaquinone biosynthesis C-methylase UbiE